MSMNYEEYAALTETLEQENHRLREGITEVKASLHLEAEKTGSLQLTITAMFLGHLLDPQEE